MADPFEAIAEPAQAGDPFAQIAEPAQVPAPPQKPSLWSRVTADYNPEAQNHNPVVRFLDQAGGNLLALPQNIVHAFSAPLTPEEQAEFKGHTRIPGEVGVERLTGAPIVRAAQTYANPETRPTLEQAVGVLPEALGAAAGQYAGGELAGRATGKVVKTIGELRNAAENIQGTARKVTGVEPAVKQEVTEAADKQGQALEDNAVKRTETVKSNLERQRQAQMDIDRQKLEVADKNKAIEQANQEQAAAVQKRADTAKQVDQQSVELGTRLQKVKESVYADAGRKFDAVRKQIGNPETEPQPLVALVKGAEENILQGIPENVKEFRTILGHGEELPADLADAFSRHADELAADQGISVDELTEGPKPISWNELQSIKSRIDARLRAPSARTMNGDLKRSLYSVRDGVVDMMGDMAEEHGAQDAWQDAKNSYRQYKEDFEEPQGPSGSGSPVAKAVDAVDPQNIRQPFLSKQTTIGNRAVNILRKYPQHGGNEVADLAQQLIQSHQDMQALPNKVAPKALQSAPEAIQLPTNKPAPTIPEPPVVDVQKVARDAIAKRASRWGDFNARDIGVIASSGIGGPILWALGERSLGGALLLPALYEGGKFAASRVLNNPKVVEWLSRTPPEEAAVLAKIPGADRVKIMDGLTRIATQSGRRVQLSPQAMMLLGPSNVRQILASNAALSTGRIKNAMDAKEALQPVP